jgi:hypothetical protein
MGVTESFLNKLAGSVMKPREQRQHDRDLFTPCHPVLYRPAVLALDFLAWWRYRITRTGPSCGSQLCWQKEHWRDGKLGPVAAELNRQLAEHERYERYEPRRRKEQDTE